MTALEWFDLQDRMATLTLVQPANGLPYLRRGVERVPLEYLDELLAAGLFEQNESVTVYVLTEAGVQRISERLNANAETQLMSAIADLDKRREALTAQMETLRERRRLRDAAVSGGSVDDISGRPDQPVVVAPDES